MHFFKQVLQWWRSSYLQIFSVSFYHFKISRDTPQKKMLHLYSISFFLHVPSYAKICKGVHPLFKHADPRLMSTCVLQLEHTQLTFFTTYLSAWVHIECLFYTLGIFGWAIYNFFSLFLLCIPRAPSRLLSQKILSSNKRESRKVKRCTFTARLFLVFH